MKYTLEGRVICRSQVGRAYVRVRLFALWPGKWTTKAGSDTPKICCEQRESYQGGACSYASNSESLMFLNPFSPLSSLTISRLTPGQHEIRSSLQAQRESSVSPTLKDAHHEMRQSGLIEGPHRPFEGGFCFTKWGEATSGLFKYCR